jgi:hypothetical protein
LNRILPESARQQFPVDGEFMEFLESDFDKSPSLAPSP